MLSITDPNVVKKRAEMIVFEDQNPLIVWKVFEGQIAEKVKNRLVSSNFELVPVPANKTHCSQPLD